ncbi:hypothetical protein Tco_1009954, partial [Tanacetum coccineum]
VPYDPTTDPALRIHPDDPYVSARDAATYSAKDDGDDTVAPRDPQPFEPRGSPCDAQGNTGGTSGNTGGNGDQGGAPPVRECTYTGFVKCNPTTFRRNDGTVELCHWLKSTESVFSINECTERNKVKFVAATLQGRALTWWKSQVATLGLEVANEKSWDEIKTMMKEEFCPPEQIQRIEKKVEAYIRGLPENFKGETTSSKPVILNDAIRMAHTLMEQKLQAKAERVTEGNKRKWENNNPGDRNNNNRNNNNRGNYRDNNYHNQYNNRRQGNARAMTTAQNDGVNQGGPAQNYNRCGLCHFGNYVDSVRQNTSYEVKLADQRIVSTNTVLRDCILNLVDHLFKIDLMPIELGTFHVIIGTDWLVERDAVIVYGMKVVHIPHNNKTLVVKGDGIASRLKVISCIKARKYIERGSQLFLAQVTEKDSTEKCSQDVHVIHDFPKVFPDDLPGLPPP